MLLRYQNGKLYLLEATNGEGVGICEWNNRNIKDYRSIYELIVYRQLQFKRSYEIVVKLESFLKVYYIIKLSNRKSKGKNTDWIH